MPPIISAVTTAAHRTVPGFNSLLFLDLAQLGVAASPVAVLDDFRATGVPFSPHPHAGFAAVTYVFEDSAGSLRSRASNGADLVVSPGGIVWTEAGSGIVHEEVPAERGRELHGVQLFVNLSAANKLIPPRVLHLDAGDVPEWAEHDGDRVRVLTGAFGHVTSPLVPAEPFTLLDIEIERGISLTIPPDNTAVAYVRSGAIAVGANGRDELFVGDLQAVAIHGDGNPVRLRAAGPAQILALWGPAIHEPIIANGPFIMTDSDQLAEAIGRYRGGAMGTLAPS